MSEDNVPSKCLSLWHIPGHLTRCTIFNRKALVWFIPNHRAVRLLAGSNSLNVTCYLN